MQCALAEIARWWRQRSLADELGVTGSDSTGVKLGGGIDGLGTRSRLQFLCANNGELRKFIAQRLLRLSNMTCALCEDFIDGTGTTSKQETHGRARGQPVKDEEEAEPVDAMDIATLLSHAASFADKIDVHDLALEAYQHAVSLAEGSHGLSNFAAKSGGHDQRATAAVSSEVDESLVNGWRFEMERLGLMKRVLHKQQYFASVRGFQFRSRCRSQDDTDTEKEAAKNALSRALDKVRRISTHLTETVRLLKEVAIEEGNPSNIDKPATQTAIAKTPQNTAFGGHAQKGETDPIAAASEARKRRIAAIRARHAAKKQSEGSQQEPAEGLRKKLRSSTSSVRGTVGTSDGNACCVRFGRGKEDQKDDHITPVDRFDCDDISLQVFHERYAQGGRAVIISGLVPHMFPEGSWDVKYLMQHLGGHRGAPPLQIPLQRTSEKSCLWARLETAGTATFAEFLAADAPSLIPKSLHAKLFRNAGTHTDRSTRLDHPPDSKPRYLHDWSIPLGCPTLIEGPQCQRPFQVPKYFANDHLQRAAALQCRSRRKNQPRPVGDEQTHIRSFDESTAGSCESSQLKYSNSWPSLFVGPHGTRSELHVDGFGSNFWMILLEGRKRWVFFDREDAFMLYPTYFEGSLDATFSVDVVNPDLNRHPLMRFARRYECVLEPGEVLFVPAGSPHYVENLTDTIALSMNFVDDSNSSHALDQLRVQSLVCREAARLYDALCDPRVGDGTFQNFDIQRKGASGTLQEIGQESRATTNTKSETTGSRITYCVSYAEFKAPPMQSPAPLLSSVKAVPRF